MRGVIIFRQEHAGPEYRQKFRGNVAALRKILADYGLPCECCRPSFDGDSQVRGELSCGKMEWTLPAPAADTMGLGYQALAIGREK